MAKSELFSLSKYARIYKNDGKTSGLMLSGFEKGDRNREASYANIWVKKGDFSVKKTSDGGYIVSIKLLEIEQVEKGEKPRKQEGKTDGRKTGQAFDEEDEDIPF